MRRHKRSLLFLSLFSSSLTGLFLLITKLQPTYTVHLYTVQFPILPLFFLLVFLALFSLITYLFRRMIHGVVAGLLVVTILLLRMFTLTHPIFFLLAGAAAVAIDLFFVYRK